jgi:hypothetical protein
VLAERDRFGRTEARRALAFGLGVLAVAYPLYAIRNVSTMTDQRGYPPAVQDACRIVGTNGAIVVPQEGDAAHLAVRPADLALVLQRSGRRSCCRGRSRRCRRGFPAASSIRACCTSSRSSGPQQHRQLFIVAGNARTIRKLFPRAAIQVVPGHANPHLLVQTLVSRPGAFQTERLSFAIARVPIG